MMLRYACLFKRMPGRYARYTHAVQERRLSSVSFPSYIFFASFKRFSILIWLRCTIVLAKFHSCTICIAIHPAIWRSYSEHRCKILLEHLTQVYYNCEYLNFCKVYC